ncbi:MAG: hypothetical protein MJ252_11620 [archaeon]|nr:hypothetical protein [archaeon]
MSDEDFDEDKDDAEFSNEEDELSLSDITKKKKPDSTSKDDHLGSVLGKADNENTDKSKASPENIADKDLSKTGNENSDLSKDKKKTKKSKKGEKKKKKKKKDKGRNSAEGDSLNSPGGSKTNQSKNNPEEVVLPMIDSHKMERKRDDNSSFSDPFGENGENNESSLENSPKKEKDLFKLKDTSEQKKTKKKKKEENDLNQSNSQNKSNLSNNKSDLNNSSNDNSLIKNKKGNNNDFVVYQTENSMYFEIFPTKKDTSVPNTRVLHSQQEKLKQNQLKVKSFKAYDKNSREPVTVSYIDSLILAYEEIKQYFDDNLMNYEPKKENEYNKGLMELLNVLDNLNEILNVILSLQRFKKTSTKANYSKHLSAKAVEQHKKNEEKIYEMYNKDYQKLEERYDKISDENYLAELESKLEAYNIQLRTLQEEGKNLKKEYKSLLNKSKGYNLEDMDKELQEKVKRLQDEVERNNYELQTVINKTEQNNKSRTINEEIQSKLEEKERELMNEIRIKATNISAYEDLEKKIKEEKKAEAKLEKLQKKHQILENAKRCKRDKYEKELKEFEKRFTELEKAKEVLENKLNEGLDSYDKAKEKLNKLAIKSNILIQSNANSSTKNILGEIEADKEEPELEREEDITGIKINKSNTSENKNINEEDSGNKQTSRNNSSEKPLVTQSAVISKASVLRELDKIEKQNQEKNERSLNNSMVLRDIKLKPNFSFPSGGLNKLIADKRKEKKESNTDGIDEDIHIEESEKSNQNKEEENDAGGFFITGKKEESKKEEKRDKLKKKMDQAAMPGEGHKRGSTLAKIGSGEFDAGSIFDDMPEL